MVCTFLCIGANDVIQIQDGDYVIPKIDFIKPVQLCGRFKPANNLMATNYLRSICLEVGRMYDSSFNPYRNVVPSDYTGIKCETDMQVAAVIDMMFRNSYPKIFESYLEHIIKTRPSNCKRLIYVGKMQDVLQIMAEQDIQKWDPSIVEEEVKEVTVDEDSKELLQELAKAAKLDTVQVKKITKPTKNKK
jgi:ribosomal protein RSM22 (predicted rRNA methylase)